MNTEVYAIIAPVVVIVAIAAAINCLCDGTVRQGFYLLPRSSKETRGIALRSIQLLFVVSLLGTCNRGSEAGEALLGASFILLIIFGLAFWESNRGQAKVGFWMILVALLITLLSPAIDR